MLCIRSAAAAVVMIMAYSWRTNRNHRQQQQYKQLFRHWSDPWLLRSSEMTAADGIDIVDVRQKCLRSVVRCYPISIHNSDRICGIGTGFRVVNNNNGSGGKEMYIVTNAHVVKGAHFVQLAMIYRNQWQYIDSTVVYVEPNRDLALIKLSIDESVDTDGYTPVPILTNNQTANFGEPVVTFATNDWNYRCHSGRVQALGVNVNQILPDYVVSMFFTGAAASLLVHSAPTVPGFSGGPLVVAAGPRIAGANDISSQFGSYYSIASNEITEFIENGIKYYKTVFPWKFMYREIKYSTVIAGNGPSAAAVVVVKLGIVLSKHINWFIVEDILPESLCPELYQKYIIAIDDQPFTNISQLTAAVVLTTGAYNNNNNRKELKLTIIDLNDNKRMDTPLMVKCQHYSQLPVVC
ncbi:uncharacterized protein LOC128955113 [Oppia nitens]|uniref:uncharacterized protein LOC128955113 n=1 Tax=Oppia nitens TaxID=1686743 RepID=UPI0023DC2007|nr:uncharacterized protein LOC128955113 [Oppia nitens]